MTYLGGSSAALFGVSQQWQGRANNAWGVSRIWGTGSSFETDSATNAAAATTWQGRANNAWGVSRVWSSGSSFETDLAAMTTSRNTWQANANAAYDGGTWGVGNLWSADAHNDPNVWTNRYNQGYSDGNTAGFTAGAASKTTTAAAVGLVGASQKTNGQDTGVLGTISAPRTGLAHLSCFTRVNRHNTNAGDFSVQMNLYRNGGLIATGPVTNAGNDTHGGISADWTGSCNSGDSFTMQCHVNSTAGGNSADFDGTGALTLSVGSV